MKRLSLVLLSTICLLSAGCSKGEDKAVATREKTPTLADYDYKKLVTLGEYKGFRIPVSVEEVTDDAVDAALQSLVDANIEQVEKTGVAETGDFVKVSYTLREDGTELTEYTTSEEVFKLGDGHRFSELDTALVGVESADVQNVSVHVPDDFYDSNIAGKDVNCHITVNAVYQSVIPEVTDAWISGVSDCTTVDEWKSAKRKELEGVYEDDAKWAFESEVQNKIMENATFSVLPEELVDYRMDQYMQEDEESAESMSMDLEDFILNYYGYTSMDDYKADLASFVDESIKTELLVEALQDAEGITPDKEYREQFINDCLSYYGCANEEELVSTYGADTIDSACEASCVWDTIIGYSEMVK